LYAQANEANLQWRLTYVRGAAPRFADIGQMLRSTTPVQEITRKYMSTFYYIDTPDARSTVEAGLIKLRQVGGPIYRSGEQI
jgi:hypothetical protein